MCLAVLPHCNTTKKVLVNSYTGVAQDNQAIFEDAWTSVGQANSMGPPAARGLATEYLFQANNPYDANPEALEIARTAFAQGSLTTAVLALEAVVKLAPSTFRTCQIASSCREREREKNLHTSVITRPEVLWLCLCQSFSNYSGSP
jgi:hypothetical protein